MRAATFLFVVAVLSSCASSEMRRDRMADADFLFLFLEQQRLQQALFLKQMESIRIVQCLPDGFAVVCR